MVAKEMAMMPAGSVTHVSFCETWRVAPKDALEPCALTMRWKGLVQGTPVM